MKKDQVTLILCSLQTFSHQKSNNPFGWKISNQFEVELSHKFAEDESIAFIVNVILSHLTLNALIEKHVNS